MMTTVPGILDAYRYVHTEDDFDDVRNGVVLLLLRTGALVV